MLNLSRTEYRTPPDFVPCSYWPATRAVLSVQRSPAQSALRDRQSSSARPGEGWPPGKGKDYSRDSAGMR